VNERPTRPLRLLVIRLRSLGDVILATPLIRNLRARFPEAAIDMLTGERYLQLLEGIPQLAGRLAYPVGSRARRAARGSLAEAGYDIIIDLQNNLTSRLIAAAIGPARLYRYRRPRFNRWLRIHLPRLRDRLPTPPAVAIGYIRAAARLQVRDDGRGLELIPTGKWRRSAGALLEDYHRQAGIPPDTLPLIVAPGARHKTKIWPADRWVELLLVAYDAGFRSQVIVGGEDDLPLADQITELVSHPVLVTAGLADLGELVALISMGCALVSSDSGPMHIAAAVGTPVVAIFGPTVPDFGFAPLRCPSEIVQVEGLTCRPCHPHGPERCPRRHFRCMLDIDARRVFSALARLTGAGVAPVQAASTG